MLVKSVANSVTRTLVESVALSGGAGGSTSFQLVNVCAYLKMDVVVGGKYVDQSGNGLDADAVTITTENDGIKLPSDSSLELYLMKAGLYPLFYDAAHAPKNVLKAQLGRIYNNQVFFNDTYLLICSEPLTGSELTNTNLVMFGNYNSYASAIITALGITSNLQKRLIDTHVKDLIALNTLQANFFKYNDPANSVLKALYPMVGSTFANMKFNWVQPVDADASYRLELIEEESDSAVRAFRNCMFFDSTFCLNTNFNASTKLASTNSFSYYSLFHMTDAYVNRYLAPIVYNEGRYEMGCLGVSGGYKGIALTIRQDNAAHSICENTYQNPSQGVSYAEIDSMQYYLTNKSANDSLKQYRQGVQIGNTKNPGASTYYNGNIILGGYSLDGVVQSTKRSVLPCGYFHIGGAINADVLTPFHNAVIRLCSSKNYYYFEPEETAPVL